jgi:hypothetical protein
VKHGGEAYAAANEEDADSFGSIDLVTGEGEKVDVLERAFGA